MPAGQTRPTFGEVTIRGAERLENVGITTARLDARLIVARSLGGNIANLIAASRDPVPLDQLEKVEAAITRREQREPLAQILGEKEFWSLAFTVTQAVLTPRPDSETLIEAICRSAASLPKASILDMGTGSGCLLLALLSELPESHGIGIDISEDAIAVAQKNALQLGLANRSLFCVSDWAAPLTGEFDIIVSNPPYIATDSLADLEPEVTAFEPVSALDGGYDGLDAYRTLLPQARRLMKPDGRLILEFGSGQAKSVSALAETEGLMTKEVDLDLAEIERCVTLQIRHS